MMKHLAKAAGLVIAVIASPAIAQTAIQPGTIVGTFGAVGYASGTTIHTVPNDRYARVTDIRLLYFGSTPCFMNVYLGPNGSAYYGLTTQYQTISDHMVSGYGIAPGQTVSAYTQGCPGTNVVLVEIRGFYFTIP